MKWEMHQDDEIRENLESLVFPMRTPKQRKWGLERKIQVWGNVVAKQRFPIMVINLARRKSSIVFKPMK